MLSRWFEPTVEKTCPSCGYKRSAKIGSDISCPVCKAEYPKDKTFEEAKTAVKEIKKQLSVLPQAGLGGVLILAFVVWALWPESKNVTPELSRK